MAETKKLAQLSQEIESKYPTTAQEVLAGEKKVPNSGNPIFTCLGEVKNPETGLPRDEYYQPHHPLYQTSSNAYGEMHSTPASVPSTFHSKSMKFSQHLGVCGMYRNQSLNTAMDRSKVYDPPRM